MRKAILCPKHLNLMYSAILLLSSLNCFSQNLPLESAFAHNDYWHKRPLYDALDNGYTHIEADIYLRKGKLIVAHILPFLKKKKTLEQLYLKPLMDGINGTNKEMASTDFPIMLMIDIKSKAGKTYAELEKLLNKYRSMLTCYENGILINRKVTVVLTGHKPLKFLAGQQRRLAFIDDDLMKVYQDTISPAVYRTASCKYSHMLKWTGTGRIPDSEKQRLCQYVTTAHKSGKKVRLWASPENKAVWRELLNCGVDLINTNRLVALRNFLLSDIKNYAKAD